MLPFFLFVCSRSAGGAALSSENFRHHQFTTFLSVSQRSSQRLFDLQTVMLSRDARLLKRACRRRGEAEAPAVVEHRKRASTSSCVTTTLHPPRARTHEPGKDQLQKTMSAVVDPATLTGASGAAVGADGTVSGGASTTAHQYSGSWNLYREVADILHIVGTLILILVILKNGHCKGISYKTQLCWMLVFVSRYLDLSSNMTNYQSSRDWHVLYLVLFKITYIGCQAVILFCFYHFNKTSPGSVYEAHKDTFNLSGLLSKPITAQLIQLTQYLGMPTSPGKSRSSSVVMFEKGSTSSTTSSTTSGSFRTHFVKFVRFATQRSIHSRMSASDGACVGQPGIIGHGSAVRCIEFRARGLLRFCSTCREEAAEFRCRRFIVEFRSPAPPPPAIAAASTLLWALCLFDGDPRAEEAREARCDFAPRLGVACDCCVCAVVARGVPIGLPIGVGRVFVRFRLRVPPRFPCRAPDCCRASAGTDPVAANVGELALAPGPAPAPAPPSSNRNS